MNKDNLGKPFKETESLRIWKQDKNHDLKEYKDDKGFEIDLGKNQKMKCLGFTELRDKKTKKLIFAYKFKHEDKFILYYNPTKDKKFFELLNKVCLFSGYKLQDLDENLKSIKLEVDIMENDEEKK